MRTLLKSPIPSPSLVEYRKFQEISGEGIGNSHAYLQHIWLFIAIYLVRKDQLHTLYFSNNWEKGKKLKGLEILLKGFLFFFVIFKLNFQIIPSLMLCYFLRLLDYSPNWSSQIFFTSPPQENIWNTNLKLSLCLKVPIISGTHSNLLGMKYTESLVAGTHHSLVLKWLWAQGQETNKFY